MAKFVVKSTKLRQCKCVLRSARGRPPSYCSAACRKKAYRARVLKNPPLVRLMQDRLDRAATIRHVEVLERLRYKVVLERVAATPTAAKKPRSLLVNTISAGPAVDLTRDVSGTAP